jgi:MFS transporter, PHS family, inorganic phosphate transporter
MTTQTQLPQEFWRPGGTVTRALLAQMDGGATVREHWKILLTCGMGFFTDAYDLFIVGVVGTMVAAQWHAAGYQVALLSSLALLTSAAGAVIFGKLADVFGRTRVYGYEMLLLAGGAIASAFAPGIWWLIGLRALLGLGIGGDYPVSATIMSENACRRNRGRMISLVFTMQAAGLITGPLVAIVLLQAGLPQNLTWRLLLALGAVPALAVYRLRRQLAETPRFRLAQSDAGDSPAGAGTAPPGAGTARPGEPAVTGLSGVLAHPRLRRWLAGTAAAWLLFDFAYYGTTISTHEVVHLVDPRASLTGTIGITLGIFAVAALPGYLLAAALIDRIGRRRLQLGGFAMMAAGFAGLWLIPGATSMVLPFLLLYGLTYFFAEFGPNTTTFVYPAELFPVRARASSHGLAAAAGKIGAFAGTYALTALLPALGLGPVSGLIAAVCLAGLVVTAVLLPEPAGVSLEDMEAGHHPERRALSAAS